MILLSEREYDALLARGDDDAAEDRMTGRMVDDARAAGPIIALPLDVWAAIDAGEPPVKVLRRHRGLTQVAEAADLKQGYLSDLERGDSQGTPDTWVRLAKALDVSVDVLLTRPE